MNKKQISIEQYLSSSRCIISNVKDDSLLQKLFARAKDDLPIHLCVVNSINRECEIINYQGKTYLVYDQFLTKTFHDLNRILHSKDRDAISYYYNFRLISQLMLIIGDLLPSHYFLKWGTKHHQPSDQNLEDNFSAVSSSYYSFQEFFVLLHEVSHIKFNRYSKSDKKKLIEKTRKEIKKQFKAFNEIIDTKGIVEDIIKEKLIKKEELDSIVKGDISNMKPEKVLESYNKRSLKLIDENDDFIEEVICDRMAVESFSTKVKSFNKQMMIPRAILMALLHLRTLGCINNFSFKYGYSNREKVNHFFLESELRYFFLRNFLVEKGNKSIERYNKREIHTLFDYDKKKYNDTFLNLIYFKIPKVFASIRQEFPTIFKTKLSFMEKRETRNRILNYYQDDNNN